MTKYILHGGASSKQTVNNKKFFLEIAKDLPDPANILVICFARPKKEWPETFEKIKKEFEFFVSKKTLKIKLASDRPNNLIKQIKNADAIYMPGGTTLVLKKYLEKISNLKNLWKNKTVAGSSAGALVLAKYFYGNDNKEYYPGLGILPMKIFCHYTKKQSIRLQKLKDFGEKMRVQTIAEEKFVVIKQ